MSRFDAGFLARYAQSHRYLDPSDRRFFDAVGLASFTVVGVVVVLDTSAPPFGYGADPVP